MSDYIEIVESDNLEDNEQKEPLNSIIPEDEKKDVINYLTEEYNACQSEIETAIPTWNKWRRQRLSLTEKPRKDFPFPNASNVSVPLTRIILQTLYGKLKAAFSARKPPFKVTALRDNSDDKKKSKVITKYYELISKSPTELNLNKKSDTIYIDGGLLGFSWVKPYWSSEKKVFTTSDGITDKEVESPIQTGISLDVCAPEDILYKHNWSSIDEVPCFFQDVHLPKHILQRRAIDEVYDNVDEVLHFSRDVGNESETEKAERQGVTISKEELYDITEAYFFWEINGKVQPLIVTFHVPSGIILKEQYNSLGFILHECLNFYPESFSITGTGVGLACEHMQDEVDAIHNMRNDNMKLANMRMIIARRGGSIKPNEKIYPGKVFLVDSPREDVNAFQLGEIYPSSERAEALTQMYAQKATGMNDAMAGFSDQNLGSRDTFRGQFQRLQQGQGILSSVMENMVEGYSNLARKIFYILVQNKEAVINNERIRQRMTEEDIDILEEVLNIPLDEIPFRMNFDIRMTDIEQTFESRRQNLLALTQLYTQYANQILPLAMQIFTPEGKQMSGQAPELYQQMIAIYIGATKLIKEVFELFGVDDSEEYLPSTQKAEMIQDYMRQMDDMIIQMNKFSTGATNANRQVERSYGEDTTIRNNTGTTNTQTEDETM